MSEGKRVSSGTVQRAGLDALAVVSLSIPGMNADWSGPASHTCGITMASGAPARHPDLPLTFLIDWEGPADRGCATVGYTLERSDMEW
jgi:hypothetical protein